MDQSVHSLAFSPDGKILASGDYGSTVKLWDVDSVACLGSCQGHAPGHIYALAWSANGHRIASACSDSTIRIWQVDTGHCEQVIEGENWSMSVDWNPVNDLLALSYFEQPIQIRDIQTGQTVQTLRSRLPYDGMNIAKVTGISEGQTANLKALGAIES